jgi:pilus assembly protein Flp/PilA
MSRGKCESFSGCHEKFARTAHSPESPLRDLYESQSGAIEMVKSLVRFLKREDGPTAVEYAVMLALIIVVCIAAITTLGGNANSTFTSVGNSVAS